jgi:hypothetical protein
MVIVKPAVNLCDAYCEESVLYLVSPKLLRLLHLDRLSCRYTLLL